MNIFILDTDVKLNAQYHANTHVVKQVLEYCQLLSTACHLHGVALEGMYKLTHKSHPATLWTLESKQLSGFAIDFGFMKDGKFSYQGDWEKCFDLAEHCGLISLWRKSKLEKPHLEFDFRKDIEP